MAKNAWKFSAFFCLALLFLGTGESIRKGDRFETSISRKMATPKKPLAQVGEEMDGGTWKSQNAVNKADHYYEQHGDVPSPGLGH